MEEFQTVVLPIVLIATLTRSTFGFGDAMVGMPLLAMVIPLDSATPLVGLMGITASATILVKHWREVHLKSVGLLIVFTVIGIPVGILLLKRVNEDIMKSVLAFVIITFSLYRMFKPRLFSLADDRLVWFFGLVSGMLGAAYNANGPPVVIYGTLRGWDPEKFRATLQGYFFPTGSLIAIGHCVGGLWTRPVLLNYAFSLPIILAAIFLGGRINRRIPRARFDNYIYAFLVILGVFLLISTVRSLM